mgnify:CR=1 FL=1
MNETESQWDKLLKIKTTGRDDSHADQYRYPYEPTPYSVLERLANSGLIGKGNTLLDYGTGKGRVCFYLSYQTRCHSIGVEYDERIFSGAEENRLHAVSGNRTAFEMKAAETIPYRQKWIAAIFLIPFRWNSFRKFSPRSTLPTTKILVSFCCFLLSVRRIPELSDDRRTAPVLRRKSIPGIFLEEIMREKKF